MIYLAGIALAFVEPVAGGGRVRRRRADLAGARTAGSSGSWHARARRAGVSADRVETYGGEEYVVRRVTGSAARPSPTAAPAATR